MRGPTRDGNFPGFGVVDGDFAGGEAHGEEGGRGGEGEGGDEGGGVGDGGYGGQGGGGVDVEGHVVCANGEQVFAGGDGGGGEGGREVFLEFA